MENAVHLAIAIAPVAKCMVASSPTHAMLHILTLATNKFNNTLAKGWDLSGYKVA